MTFPIIYDFYNKSEFLPVEAGSKIGAKLIFNNLFHVNGDDTVVEPIFSDSTGKQIGWNAYLQPKGQIQ